MRTKISIFTIGVVMSFTAVSQCPSTPLVLSTQAEVDAFVSSFPNCNLLEGDLTISGSDISDLSGMPMDTIDGDFSILLNHGLTSFTGLDLLKRIEGNLNIASNFDLLDFTGLDQLQYIGGDLYLNTNFISSYNGFQGLDTIQGSLKINGSSFVPDLSGFDNLAYLGSDLSIKQSEFQTLDGLQSLKEIYGDLVLFNSRIDVSLFGLNNIKKVGGLLNLQLLGGLALDDLTGLDNLQEVGGDLTITQSSFIHLSGLERLKTIGAGLYIGFDWRLLDFVGLDSLISIGSDFAFSYNNAQTNVNGIPRLNFIGGDLQIGCPFFDGEGMEVLSDLSGFDYSIPIGGKLKIMNSPLLSDCAKESICNHLQLSNPADIALNGVGCNSSQEVLNACGSVSVLNAKLDQDLSIFPIPSYGRLNIKQEAMNYETLSIYSSNGQKITQYSLIDQVMAIELPSQINGLVILAFQSKLETVYRKHLVVR